MSKINIGGQAVLEGVMMRAPRSLAIAVRRPDGEISVKSETVIPLSERFPITKLPIVRGAVALFASLITGIKALNFSANEALSEEEGKKEELSGWAIGGTMAFAFGFGILLFFIMPLYLTKLMVPVIGGSNIVFNLVDGVIRVAVFLIYIISISRMKDIQRVFQYHGAEHKSIFTFEAGEELTVENVKKYSCLHPRCGTSFLLIVMLVSILVFSLIPKPWPFYFKAGARIVLLPMIAGLSYEVLKWTAKRENNPFVRMLIAPGLALQRLTTREPDDSQIEVAIKSMQVALDINGGHKDDRLVV
ncbi:membrane protein [Geomonas sp. Red276]